MFVQRMRWISGVVMGCLALAVTTPTEATTVNAIGASEGDGPKTVTYHDFDFGVNGGLGDTGPGWQVGSGKNPVKVYHDPEAGAWLKKLQIPVVQPVSTSSVPDGDNGLKLSLALTEYLTIKKGDAWIDWHEKLVNPVVENTVMVGNFSWGDDYTFKVKRPGDSEFMTAPGLAATFEGDKAWFEFDPLPVGTKVFIQKEIKYVGNENAMEYLPSYLKVAQYPTVPTPSAAAAGLMLLGGVLLRRRRRMA